MKKILLISICLLAVVSVSAQVDSTVVASVATGITNTFLDMFGSWLKSHAWFSILVTVVAIFEQIVVKINWIPGNSTCQVLFFAFKAGVKILAQRLGIM
jgi:hypothetical protein